MSQFINPFSGVLPKRKMSHQELIRAIRQDIAAEQEAVHLYVAHAESATDPLAKKVLESIADEERVHIGEFTRLLVILTKGGEDKFHSKGAREVDEMGRRGGKKKKMVANWSDNSILGRATKIIKR